MSIMPVRLLTVGYALGAVGGLAVAAQGAILLGFLVFWIGGAVAVLALGTLPAFRRDATTSGEDDVSDDVVSAEELERWERERLDDRVASADPRAAAG